MLKRRSHCNEKPTHCNWKSSPCSPQLEKSLDTVMKTSTPFPVPEKVILWSLVVPKTKYYNVYFGQKVQAGTITIIRPESCVTSMEIHSLLYVVHKQTLKTAICIRPYAENSKAGKDLVHNGTEWMKRSLFIKSLEPSTMSVLIYDCM